MGATSVETVHPSSVRFELLARERGRDLVALEPFGPGGRYEYPLRHSYSVRMTAGGKRHVAMCARTKTC
jgi:hypothetical protein